MQALLELQDIVQGIPRIATPSGMQSQVHAAPIIYGPVFVGNPVVINQPNSNPPVQQLRARHPPVPITTCPPTRTLQPPTITLRLRVIENPRALHMITVPLWNNTNNGYGTPQSLDEQLSAHGFPGHLLQPGGIWGIRVVACGGEDVQRWLGQPEAFRPSAHKASSPLTGQLNYIVGDSVKNWRWWLANLWFWWGMAGGVHVGRPRGRGGRVGEMEAGWEVGAELWCR